MSASQDLNRNELNEAQRSVLEILGARAADRPTFPDGLAVGLRERLRDDLEPLAAGLGDDTVFVSKFMLAQVHGCEVRYLHERDQNFVWSVPTARGTVAHKAIELSVHWRDAAVPARLVDEAMSSLTHGGYPISDFLNQLTEADRAQLRSDATNATQAFLEGFPPLRLNPQWRPAVEVRGRWEGIAQGRIILSGKVDLSLGGPTGDRGGRVFIDLKTGRRHGSHIHDLRYYALVETLRYGTPPRQVASYYLDESRLVPETVTTDVLWSAVERVTAGVRRHLELTDSGSPAEPQYRPALGCRWCPQFDSCDEGRRFLDATEEDELDQLG